MKKKPPHTDLYILSRLFCALEGRYLVQEATNELMEGVDNLEHDEQCINFSCPIPVTIGRGFIEVLFSSDSYRICRSILI